MGINTPVRTDSPDVRSEDSTGIRIGNSYRLTEPIGSGGTGAVWRAVDLDRGVDVAVKLLHEDLMHQPKAVTRFVQERAILLMLRHPNIVGVRDLLTVGESLGLVMDLVEGGSLRDHLRERGTVPPSAAATLLAQVASALAEAHRNGVVHRDLKPDNILLDRNGDARLTDFGIARVLDNPRLTTSGAMVGTANYIAPETIYGGKVTPSVDIYALGVVLYEMIAGQPPYAGGPAWAILRRHVDEAPPAVPGMPPAAWRVIEACMDRRPGCRPAAAELVTTLESLARRTAGQAALAPLEPDAAETTTILPSPRAKRPRVGLLSVLIVVVVALVLGVPAWRLLEGTGRRMSPAAPPQQSRPIAHGSLPALSSSAAAEIREESVSDRAAQLSSSVSVT